MAETKNGRASSRAGGATGSAGNNGRKNTGAVAGRKTASSGEKTTAKRTAGSQAPRAARAERVSRSARAEQARLQALEEERLRAEQEERQKARQTVRDEILVIIILLFCVLLVLSYLGLCSKFGEMLNYAVFGLFGSFGYVFPFVLFFLSVFAVANRNNPSAVKKMLYCLVMLIFVSALVQMIWGGYDPELKLKDYFENSLPGYLGLKKTYGGIFGGLICMLLCPFVGKAASIVIMIAAILIFFILTAGKAVFTTFAKLGAQRMREAEEQREQRREAEEDEAEETEETEEKDTPVPLGRLEKSSRRKNKKEQENSEETALLSTNDPEELLKRIEQAKAGKKESFLDNIIRRGMGLERERLTDIPEYKELLNKYEEAEKEKADNKEHNDESAASQYSEESDIIIAELEKKFTLKGDSEAPVKRERSKTQKHENRVYMVDEEPQTDKWDDTFTRVERAKIELANAETEEARAKDVKVLEAGQSGGKNCDEGSFAASKSNIYDFSSLRKAVAEEKTVRQEDIREEEYTPEETHEERFTQRQFDDEDEHDRFIDNTIKINRIGESAKESENRVTCTTKVQEAAKDAEGVPLEKRNTSGAVSFTDPAAAAANLAKERPAPPYVFPPMSYLKKSDGKIKSNSDELTRTVEKLQKTFESFGVKVSVTNATCGPTVTRYELMPDQGVKVKTITSLADDIKLALAAPEIRIEAPIPGKAAVGIEVPNSKTSPVLLGDLLDTPEFTDAHSGLTFAVGKDIGGKTICFDIAGMPHMLIAGATGSGKSVCINALIMSILYKAKPSEVRMIMIDPKRVELVGYNGIPHLLVPVVTDVKKAGGALNWAIAEMDDRYERFANAGVNNLKSYNRQIEEKYYEEGNEGDCPDTLPQILIIVDELNDLMMTSNSKEIEASICRLTQLARASGIHVVLATQRPSVNVITGTIKANIPSRIAFSVSSIVDSRTIIDQAGAEKLLGKGDMLFYPQGYPKPVRLQGAYVSDKEVSEVVSFIKENCTNVTYSDKISKHIDANASGSSKGKEQSFGEREESDNDQDELFEEAARFIIRANKSSIGALQREFRIGFNRASRIMSQLADEGIVGPEEGTKPRKIMMSLAQFDAYLGNGPEEDNEQTPESDGE